MRQDISNHRRRWGLEDPRMNGPEDGEPLQECRKCCSEYQYDREVMDDGVCDYCHEQAGELFCAICDQWAVGTVEPEAPESPICDKCMHEIHAEANHVDDERRYRENA